MGVLLLNSYGRFIPRRRAIEGGLISLGVMLAALTRRGTRSAGPLTGRKLQVAPMSAPSRRSSPSSS